MSNYKRQYRELGKATKQKISASSRNKPKTDEHKQRIRQGMLRYWASVPHRPTDKNNEV